MRIYLVGGAVRDFILNRPVKDRDYVVVGATPTEMLNTGFKQVGADFPVFLDKEGNEYALARKERKVGNGYHGFETEFGPNVTLEEDLYRRDLTVNSIAKDLTTEELIDPFNGLEDLRNGVLRHVSEAFAEDPVRVLRVARFAARYNFDVAPETLELMKELVNAGELDHLVAERVWLEMEKAISEEQPVKFFHILDECGAKDVLFPELGRSLIFSGVAQQTASLRNADWMTRMMILFSEIEWELSETMLKRLRAPVDVLRMVRKFRLTKEILGREHHAPGAPGLWEVTAEELLDFLKRDLDAFRRPEELFQVSAAIGCLTGNRLTQRMDKTLTAFREARKVSFGTLSEESKVGLEGPAVGRAIDEARLVKIAEVM